ncbi:MAG: 4,5-DOPA dioxygenase extradiol, partial [Leptospiraceae bacterium]|nr:4,5-DOPA dioxygenase extradiol [Leptospiraceae bacterium]
MKKFPIIFVGHGSPMNAIEENEFVVGFRDIAKTIPKPKAIFAISAHWLTSGTRITSQEKPKTIHDFFGFPEELYEIEYPALGEPKLAKEIQNFIGSELIQLTSDWGLDHGTWSVLKHMYPDADIPVLQMSLDVNKTLPEHYDFAKKFSFLRDREVLILGSGNIVHNLSLLDWKNINKIGYVYSWAEEVNQAVKKFIMEEKHSELIAIHNKGRAFQLAIPTLEHYLPLLYVLGLKEKDEQIMFFNDKGIG